MNRNRPLSSGDPAVHCLARLCTTICTCACEPCSLIRAAHVELLMGLVERSFAVLRKRTSAMLLAKLGPKASAAFMVSIAHEQGARLVRMDDEAKTAVLRDLEDVAIDAGAREDTNTPGLSLPVEDVVRLLVAGGAISEERERIRGERDPK